ncbi:hypothetical protein G7054_g7245 [Neopestalotiopsis clavispora]|nr:hypothetical protein G7054_g7245 [Neopestalotiopsis clavispora]
MVRFFPILVALFLGLAAADGLSACSAGCISQVFSDTTKFGGCATNDKVCACGSTPDFWFAIRDCITQACPSDDLDTQLADAQTDSQSQCAAASGVPATTPVTTPPPPATTVATTPTTAANTEPTTTEAAETATAPVSTATSPTSTASEETAASAATTSATSASAPSTSLTSTTLSQSVAAATSGTSATSSTSKTASGTSTAASSSSTSEAAANTSDSENTSGLTVAAQAGIGAGAGVALISALLVFCCMKRKRKNKENPSRIPTMQISKPLPGSGRQYAGDLEAARMAALSTQFRDDQLTPIKAAAYKPSIISSSQYSPTSLYAPSDYDERQVAGRRYEDMLPRTQPRTMI